MSPSSHSVRPRPGGGFNPGMGSFGEHLDEAAMQQAVQQKALGQAGGSQTKTPTPTSSQASPPRDMGSLQQELIERPLEDLNKRIKSIFDLHVWLGLDEKTPEQEQEIARKKIILDRFNKLNDEQQAIAKQRYEELLARKRAEEEEKQRQAQLKAQQEQETLVVPTSSHKGPVGPGMSKKQRAVTQLQQDRQRMSQAQGAG